MRGSDVPTYVEYGAADVGITGKDTIMEYGSALGFYERLDLGIGRCPYQAIGVVLKRSSVAGAVALGAVVRAEPEYAGPCWRRVGTAARVDYRAAGIESRAFRLGLLVEIDDTDAQALTDRRLGDENRYYDESAGFALIRVVVSCGDIQFARAVL